MPLSALIPSALLSHLSTPVTVRAGADGFYVNTRWFPVESDATLYATRLNSAHREQLARLSRPLPSDQAPDLAVLTWESDGGR